MIGLVSVAEAATNSLDTLLNKIYKVIINPAITLLFVVAFVIFIWGVVEYLQKGDSDAGRKEGAQHILWGIVGMFIMVAVFAIMHIIANTIGSDVKIPG